MDREHPEQTSKHLWTEKAQTETAKNRLRNMYGQRDLEHTSKHMPTMTTHDRFRNIYGQRSSRLDFGVYVDNEGPEYT